MADTFGLEIYARNKLTYARRAKTLTIPADTGFMQGIFVEYGITVDDDATEIRNGGFGSTTAK